MINITYQGWTVWVNSKYAPIGIVASRNRKSVRVIWSLVFGLSIRQDSQAVSNTARAVNPVVISLASWIGLSPTISTGTAPGVW